MVPGSVHSNILDPIHAELSPLVWDQPASPEPILKPLHAHWLKSQVYRVLEEGGYTDIEHWLTLVFTGSLTTYQYSDTSDVDISLFIDSKIFPEWSRAEMIALMVEKLDGTLLPGTPFPLQDFVVGEGIKPSDLYKPGLRSGYNLDNDKWIVPPEPNRAHDVKAEEGGFYAYSLQMADKMERLLRYEPDAAIQFWHQIHKKRQRDMMKGKGDFSESNIIYKMLANRGLFPQISDVSGEYIAHQKAANHSTMFHVSPIIHRQLIEQEGLRPMRAADEEHASHPEAGVFLWPDLDQAREYRGNEPYDIWEVSVPTNRLFQDEVWGVDSAYTPDRIAPAQIRRVSKIAAPEPTIDPDNEQWDNHYIGWSGTHDYDPRWDYSDELRPDWEDHPLTQLAKKHLDNLVQTYGDQHGISPGRVFAADLSHQGAVGTYIHGTGGEPVMLFDPYGHEENIMNRQEAEEQAHQTITHEFRHTMQEREAEGEPAYDEDDAENWIPDKISGKPHEPPHLRHKSEPSPDKKAELDKAFVVGKSHCGSCSMFWKNKNGKGHCWGYGEWEVERDEVCDSWSPEKRTSKTAARVLYNEFRPDPVHPKGDHEPMLPFIFNPDEDVVHLGPAGSYHWQLVEKTPELRALYGEPTWDQAPARSAIEKALGHIHGNMEWPSRIVRFQSTTTPEQEMAIREALGAPEPKGDIPTWEFQAKADIEDIARKVYENVKNGEGITINLHGEPPHTRYGFAPDLATQTIEPINTFSIGSVIGFIERFRDRLSRPDQFIGAWIQGDDAILDVTEGSDDYDTAFQRAWNGHQKALWDNEINDELPVRGLDYEQPSVA